MLSETIQNLRNAGLDLDAPATAEVLKTEWRKSADAIKLPDHIRDRVALLTYLKQEIGLNEGKLLYTLWDLLHAQEIPMPDQIART